jgi:hypothetical protein
MSPATQTGPDGNSVADYRAWMRAKVREWQGRGQPLPNAILIAWGTAENQWHSRNGARPSAGCCAGCGKRMAAGSGMTLLDGAAVHLGGDHGLGCLTDHGDKWRSEARAGLMALGLNPPKSVLSSTV